MIGIKYSCEKCGIHRQTVMVVPRSPEHEDVIEFVNRAALACSADHDKRSPNCKIDRFTEVLIPLDDDTSPIGTQHTRQ